MRPAPALGLALALAAAAPVAQAGGPPGPGGAAPERMAFSQPVLGLDPAARLDFELGRALFEKLWVPAPASTRASDGLGPLYNARSCAACHEANGRGAGPEAGAAPPALVLHLAVPVAAPAGVQRVTATAPDPIYGAQIQTFAAVGHRAEAAVTIRHEHQTVTLPDGAAVSLRRPVPVLGALAHGPLAAGAMVSPRVAPPMIGLGLLEAIPAAAILAREDPADADGDGISGRANFAWSPEAGAPVLARFGLKAGSATVLHQAALAFARDLGISTPLLAAPWGDCTPAQTACRAAPHGDGDARRTELSADALELVAFYARSLAVPARRAPDDPAVRRGEAAFQRIGCAACHVPMQPVAQPGGAAATIRPYTDLLLHDMGPGLADGLAEGRANGQEWRTPPLWGIGLTAAVSGETTFLHDGRARSLFEAILWHGGEAQGARDSFAGLPGAERDALIRFLESL